jgi:hypothetical protein
MKSKSLTEWQRDQIALYKDDLSKCETLEELVNKSREMVQLSSQTWFLKGCMPTYNYKLKQIKTRPSRNVVAIDLKALCWLAWSRAKGSDQSSNEFLSLMKGIKARFASSPIVFADECEQGGWRYQYDARWKSKRIEVDPGLLRFVNRVREMLAKWECQVCKVETFEADDVLASLATSYALAGDKTVIISQDRDLFQLLGPQTTTFWVSEFFSRENLFSRYALVPQSWIDWLCLVGKNDIPGAQGIGEIYASKLLAMFGNYVNCLDALPQIASQFSEKVAAAIQEFDGEYLRVRRLHALEKSLRLEVSYE